MNTTITCTESHHLTEWAQVLVDRGWKIIQHRSSTIKAKRHMGQSEYPSKNTTVWYITLEETEEDMLVEITVPAFANSQFSRVRLYEEFSELAEGVGEFETEEDLEIDILRQVRIKSTD